MATIPIEVPINGNRFEIDGWLYNVSTHIDAGDDVEFIDSDGLDVNISRVQMNTAGNIAIWGKGDSKSDAVTIALSAGIFHDICGIHGFSVTGTSTSVGIHVKI